MVQHVRMRLNEIVSYELTKKYIYKHKKYDNRIEHAKLSKKKKISTSKFKLEL